MIFLNDKYSSYKTDCVYTFVRFPKSYCHGQFEMQIFGKTKGNGVVGFSAGFSPILGEAYLDQFTRYKAHAVHPNSTKLKSNKQRSGGSLFVLLGYLLFNNAVHEF